MDHRIGNSPTAGRRTVIKPSTPLHPFHPIRRSGHHNLGMVMVSTDAGIVSSDTVYIRCIRSILCPGNGLSYLSICRAAELEVIYLTIHPSLPSILTIHPSHPNHFNQTLVWNIGLFRCPTHLYNILWNYLGYRNGPSHGAHVCMRGRKS